MGVNKVATTIKRDKYQNAVTYSSAAALNSERGSEWRIFAEGTVAPIQCVYPGVSGRRACITEVSGWSENGPQVIRVRGGSTTLWGTAFWKIKLADGTVAFDYKFGPPIWGDYGASLIAELTTDAGAGIQGISAAGFFEKSL